MNAQDIRAKYLAFFEKRDHAVIPRAKLVPENDPTTLFTGSGMQPLVPYLLGEAHPAGTRLTDSQTCLRAQDIDEIGDNRHTTFFEMLGNWSLGDYSKRDQINWFWEFITKEIGLDPQRIFVSCFSGDETAGIPKDTESAGIWSSIFESAHIEPKQVDIITEENGAKVGDQGGRIFFYREKNWWCRAGKATAMPVGEPGGPDTEMFYLFPDVEHDPAYGEHCHVNCDCGRYIELGNSVFMEYIKTEAGFEKLPKQNVDYGGGLERIAAAALNSPDVYKISVMWPIVQMLEKISGKTYETHTNSMRVITDHLRAATFLAVDGVTPSNKEQGYVMRRLLRRAIRFAFELGVEQNFLQEIVPVIADLYENDFPEVKESRERVIEVLVKEEKVFRQTLRKGLQQLQRFAEDGLTGEEIFTLYDTFGFPVELSTEEAGVRGIALSDTWQAEFDAKMAEQRARSQTAAKGTFKGGLGGHTLQHKKYHTATHLLQSALRQIFGNELRQHGSNITEERLRFDFNLDRKMTPEEIAKAEELVNGWIAEDLPVTFTEYPTKQALAMGAIGPFGERYGDTVKVYQMGDNDHIASLEICGGPHVDHTGQLAEGNRKFKITKEEASSAGIRRIKASLITDK